MLQSKERELLVKQLELLSEKSAKTKSTLKFAILTRLMVGLSLALCSAYKQQNNLTGFSYNRQEKENIQQVKAIHINKECQL